MQRGTTASRPSSELAHPEDQHAEVAVGEALLKLWKVRDRLTRRLAYLEAQLPQLPEKRARWNRDEADALREALRRLGLLVPTLVDTKVQAVREKVFPVEQDRAARRIHWKGELEQLVLGVTRIARVV